MTPLLKKLIVKVVLGPRQPLAPADQYSSYELAKGFLEAKVLLYRLLKDILLITLGVLSASFGFKGFLLTNGFLDGGATGISLLIHRLTHVPLWLLIVVVNIPFVAMGFRVVNTEFAIKTAFGILGLSLCLAFVTFPNITNDNLLVAVFGGFFLGAGIGLSVRGGAVIDGTEVLAIYLSRKLGVTVGDIIIGINVFVFGAAAYLLNVETALYSMITYLSASKTLDFIIEGIEEYTGVTIVSSHHHEVREMIIQQMGRGVTVYVGGSGYGKSGSAPQRHDILYTVITRLEWNKLRTEIELIDPNAFIVLTSVKDTKGGIVKKRRLH